MGKKSEKKRTKWEALGLKKAGSEAVALRKRYMEKRKKMWRQEVELLEEKHKMTKANKSVDIHQT